MGRVASAGDNTATESFNSPPQNNALDTRRGEKEELKLAIVTWIATDLSPSAWATSPSA
jgi:hypothetical protein